MTQVFVQSLADYNAGRIVGEWVDVSGMDENDLQDAINSVLAQSKEEVAEEWMIADYDGFYSLDLGEYSSNKTIIKVAKGIQEHGEAYALYAGYHSLDYATVSSFEDNYQGAWDSFTDYAEDLFDQIYGSELPENIKTYIDYDAFSRDLAMDYFYETDSEGKTHIFSC